MGAAIALFVSGCAAGLVGGLWIARRRRRSDAAAVAALPALERPGRTAEEVLRGDDDAAMVELDALVLKDELRPFLVDVARQHGAREVTVWRSSSADDPVLDIVACSADGTPPVGATWGNAVERSLVAWSAAEQMVGFERRDGEPRIAICPVKFASGEAAGAIVLAADERFTTGRDALRDWLPRHASQVARLVSVVSTRNVVARQSKYMRALLRITRDLQKTHEPDKLEGEICRYALLVTGADFASLVRWDATARSGTVTAATEGTPASLAGGAVATTSMAGVACLEASTSFWEDARFLKERGGVLRDDEGLTAGSLALLPLLRSGVAIGALVIGAHRTGALRTLEVRNGTLLGTLAVNALEVVWELAETSRRSRTDALTGLWNRRHFDEQLERVLAETDRFGGSCALVICDIDFFKKVNDTFGHDAGDAVLQRVSAVLRDGVRTVDVCARLGGEELALILPQTSLEGAVELAERLRQRTEAMVVSHAGASIRVTVSIGVATYSAGSDAKGQVFKRADERLYEAKHGGRNRVVS